MLVPSFPSLLQTEDSKNWQGQLVTDRGGDGQRSWLSRKVYTKLQRTSKSLQVIHLPLKRRIQAIHRSRYTQVVQGPSLDFVMVQILMCNLYLDTQTPKRTMNKIQRIRECRL